MAEVRIQIPELGEADRADADQLAEHQVKKGFTAETKTRRSGCSFVEMLVITCWPQT
jgi:hypothetical protein